MKFKIIFLAIIFSGISIYYFISSGFYPIAVVNGQFISAGSFENHVSSGLVYYQNLSRTYPSLMPKIDNVKTFINEVHRATLDKLVEDRLVYQELKKRLSDNVSRLVDQKLITSIDSKVAALYGLTSEEFKEMVLRPQARRELLESQLKDEGNFNDWLLLAQKNSTVRLLTNKFTWNQDGIKHNCEIKNTAC